MTDKELNNGCECGREGEEKESCGCGHDHEHHHHDHDHECGCGHDHDHEEGETLVVDFEDENGNIVSFDVVDSFEYTGSDESLKNNVYALIQDPNDDSVFLMKADTDESLIPVEDENEFEIVSKFYQDELA
jgi:ABC-type Zn2+ transport system substrate-binding protein/surface adhesin